MAGILGSVVGNLAGGDIGRATVALVLDQSGFSANLEKAKVETASATGQMTAGVDAFKAAAVAGAAVAAGAIVKFGADSVRAYEESAAIAQQTNAVIQSTGGIAGVTADEVQKLGSAFQHLTTYSDEDVRSAENLLLTFTSIGKDIFPETTQVVLDMSTALGQSLKQSAIQVGKALQNPTVGLTALRRVGVSFTDQQTQVIEKLSETGHTAEAQQKILEELNKEFGGSAAAAADTYSGKLAQLKNDFNDLQENIGHAVVPALDDAATAMNNLINITTDTAGHTNLLGQALDVVFVKLNPLVAAWKLSEGAINGVASALGVSTEQTQANAQATIDAASATTAWDKPLTVAADAQARLAQETRKATQAQQEQRLAQLQAAGGLLGLVSSLQQANEDQRTLNKLQAEGKTRTQAYRDAVVKATTDQLAFRTAVRQYVADNPNRSLSQTRDALREMAAQAGITGQQFRSALGGPLKDVIASLDNLQSKRVNIHVDSSQLDFAQARAERLQQALARLS
jgi:hypothetical protein